jgi:hypothetical protein
MRRTLVLAVLFLILGAGAWYAYAAKQKQKGTLVRWDMDFKVDDPDEIGKIFIANRKGESATIERKKDGWVYNDQYPARLTAVTLLLETMNKLNVLYVPTEAATDNMVKELAAKGKKVEIYDRRGKIMKTYYVGGGTTSQDGTVMILEGSNQPYVVHLPGFVGRVDVRYMIGDEKWRDRIIFAEKPEKIQEIRVEYPQKKSDSFILEKKDALEYQVRPLFSTTPESKAPRRKGKAEGYILQFENLGAEAIETKNPNRDSIVALVPFAIVSLKRENGSSMEVKFWPCEIIYDPKTGAPFTHRYFAEVDKENFALIQDRVFARIFRGYGYFFE